MSAPALGGGPARGPGPASCRGSEPPGSTAGSACRADDVGDDGGHVDGLEIAHTVDLGLETPQIKPSVKLSHQHVDVFEVFHRIGGDDDLLGAGVGDEARFVVFCSAAVDAGDAPAGA